MTSQLSIHEYIQLLDKEQLQRQKKTHCELQIWFFTVINKSIFMTDDRDNGVMIFEAILVKTQNRTGI